MSRMDAATELHGRTCSAPCPASPPGQTHQPSFETNPTPPRRLRRSPTRRRRAFPRKKNFQQTCRFPALGSLYPVKGTHHASHGDCNESDGDREGQRRLEAGRMPSEQELSEMGAFNEQLVAGIMLAGEGLHATQRGRRIHFGRRIQGRGRSVRSRQRTDRRLLAVGRAVAGGSCRGQPRAVRQWRHAGTAR